MELPPPTTNSPDFLTSEVSPEIFLSRVGGGGAGRDFFLLCRIVPVLLSKDCAECDLTSVEDWSLSDF